MPRSSQEKKNFIVLKQKNDVDKIINFFMNSYCNKIGIFVKLMRKVSMKCENWRDFRDLHSTQLQEEDWSKIKILSLNSQVRFTNYRMKINCMNDSKDFQDVKSVCSGHSHVTSRPVSFPPHPVPEGMLRHSLVSPSRKEGPPSIWDTHGISGNVFFQNQRLPVASSTASFAQELNPWISCVSEHTSPHVISESQTPVLKELWGRPTTTADFGSSFRQIPYISDICLLEDKFQDRGM